MFRIVDHVDQPPTLSQAEAASRVDFACSRRCLLMFIPRNEQNCHAIVSTY